MAGFSLPDPAFWILKIIQAAVACDSRKVVISQTRRETEVAFCPGKPLASETLFERLSEVCLHADDPLNLLVAGLQAAGHGQGRRFSIEVSSAEQSDVVIFDGERLKSRTGSGALETSGVQVVHLRLTWPDADYRRALVDEACLLVERCCACPVELKLGGRVINRLEPSMTAVSTRYLALGGFSGADSPSKFLAPEALFRRRTSRVVNEFLGLKQPLYVLSPETREVSSIFQMQFCYSMVDTINDSYGRTSRVAKPVPVTSQLVWLRHGVVACTEHLQWPAHSIRCRIFLDATDLPSDATGFALRGRLEERDRRRRAALRDIASSLPRLEEALNLSGGRIAGAGLLAGALVTLVACPTLLIPLAGKALLGTLSAGVAAARLAGERNVGYREEFKAFSTRFKNLS